ncbi:MAG: two-component system KDP operon response regulator KdpE [Verrucomicrobiales bacterium]|jgi:two-component system KDP operon response regulator KdpE
MINQNTMQAQLQAQPASAGGTRARILIVEDDRDTMNWLTILLKQNNFETLGAGDGTQAMSMVVRERPDLVILDIGLPAGNGIFVLENIRRNQSIQLTPVIVWSGAPAFRPQEAIDAGASCFLPKPCTNESILHAVEAALLTAAHNKAQLAAAAAPPPTPTEVPASPFGRM